MLGLWAFLAACPCTLFIDVISLFVDWANKDACLLSIVYQFRDKAKNWSKIVIFSYPLPLHLTPLLGWSPSEYCHPVWYGKTRKSSYPMVEKLWGYVYSFRHNTSVWRTDGQKDGRADRQTYCHGIVRAMHMRRTVKFYSIFTVRRVRYCTTFQACNTRTVDTAVKRIF